MGIERRSNKMGGESVFVSSGSDLGAVPDDFQDLLSDDVIHAFFHPKTFFRSLGKELRTAAIAEWMRKSADAGLFALELHKSEYVDSVALFRFNSPDRLKPAISFAGDPAPDLIPGPLRDFYRVFGETKHYGFEMSGGIRRANQIQSIAEMQLEVDDEAEFDSEACFVFYDTSYGDSMCFQEDGSALWHAHELGALVPYGTIEEFINAYFAALSQGKQLQPEE